MKLPNSDTAYVPEPKLMEYLLSPSHPEGGPKSVLFGSAGYSQANSEALEEVLLRIAHNEEVIKHFHFEFGDKYVVDGALPREHGTEIPLRTVWVIDEGSDAPRFVTAYPL